MKIVKISKYFLREVVLYCIEVLKNECVATFSDLSIMATLNTKDVAKIQCFNNYISCNLEECSFKPYLKNIRML